MGLGKRLRKLLKHPENEPNPETILNVCFLPRDSLRRHSVEDADDEQEHEEEQVEVIQPRRKATKRPASSKGGGYMGYDLSGRKLGESHGKKFYSLKKELGWE